MQITGNEAWIAAGVGMILSFFFGRSGVFQKTIDFVFKTKEYKQSKADEELKERDDRIKEMATTMNSLKDRITQLDKDLIKTTTYLRTLLSYLETLLPEGANPFIVELAKEIRKGNTDLTNNHQ